ncbi:hypothetical protein BES34_021285 [Leptospira inadai serovar Lyme]|uniref:Uncharacterized protein n=1 Tax=Leptospira inadai serovar Lyme TaxID=293084 RepID=A0ABX4YCK7_9LEPT|nr:hypothetical protein BES34_021285 [Leptospira inadai serovar Lyme]
MTRFRSTKCLRKTIRINQGTFSRITLYAFYFRQLKKEDGRVRITYTRRKPLKAGRATEGRFPV